MRVQVKLYATLREYAPKETEIGEAFTVEITGNTLDKLIEHFGFPKIEAKIVMINGNRIDDLDYPLEENDLVVIFPPVGG